jgi:hypothetical protein
MGSRLVFTSVDELKAEFERFAPEAAADASALVLTAAAGAAGIIRTVYSAHVVSGHLAAGVSVRQKAVGTLDASAKVISASPIAWLFDNGSQARHYVTKAGKTHATGTMWGKTPPTHIFVRTLQAARRALSLEIRALLVRKGLDVTGDGL